MGDFLVAVQGNQKYFVCILAPQAKKYATLQSGKIEIVGFSKGNHDSMIGKITFFSSFVIYVTWFYPQI